MKATTPTLLPLLRSRTQGDVIAHLVLNPERVHTATEVAGLLGVSVPTVTREVQRLVDAGLLSVVKRGSTRLLTVRTDNPVYRPLADLMAVTCGPVPVLRSLLEQVPGIEEAFIHGSWAARYHGGAGPVPDDIDLFVIGSPDRGLLADAVAEAELALHREVNARRVSRRDWDGDDGSFKATVSPRPTVSVLEPRRAEAASA